MEILHADSLPAQRCDAQLSAPFVFTLESTADLCGLDDGERPAGGLTRAGLNLKGLLGSGTA